MAERGPFYPEQHRNHIPLRGKESPVGGSRFFIQTGHRPRTEAPTITREETPPPQPVIPDTDKLAPAPTKEETQRLNRTRGKPKQGLSTPAKVGLGGFVLIVGVGTAETIPVVRHATADFINHFRGNSLASTSTEAAITINPREVFDNGAEKAKVGKNILSKRSLEEIKQRLQQNPPDKNARIVTMTWAIDFQDGETIRYDRPESPWQPTRELQAQVENGVKPDIVFNLNKGNIFKAPLFIYNGELPSEYRGIIVRNSPSLGSKDTNMTQFGRFFLYYKNSDVTLMVWFSGQGLNEQDQNFLPLIPMRGNDNWNGLGWKTLQEFNPGDPVMRATKDQRLHMKFEGFRGQEVGGIPELVDKTAFIVTPNFLLDENRTITNLQP